jgi:hypothetical protein
MPTRLNLLAEDQALEEMKRKDPVKRAIWVGGFVISLVLLWGLSLFLKITIAKVDLARLEMRWNGMEAAVKGVQQNGKRQVEVEQTLSALSQFSNERFLYANAMNAFQQTCVDNVQLLRLRSIHSYTQVEGAKPPPPPPGAPPGLPRPAARPATAVERIMVSLDGRDMSSRAAEQVPRFREVIASYPFFKEHLQKTNSILLTSLSAPTTDATRKTTSVVFGLQLNFQEKERHLYE